MFRKIMAVSATVALVALSACSSVTGPEKTKSNGSGRPAPRPPQELDRVCLSDLRAVSITSPSEGALLYGDEVLMVQWQTREICGRYTAELLVSTDNGRNFDSAGTYVNATSALWRIPNLDGAKVVTKVIIHDSEGEVFDDLAVAHPIYGHTNGGHRIKVPQQRD